LLAPVAEVSRSAGIYIVRRMVTFLAATKNYADEVVGAGRVVVILQSGSDLVVRLGDDLGRGYLLGIVAKSAKGLNVSHGEL